MAGRPVRIPLAGAAGVERPDPSRGVFSTLLVRDGEAVDASAHLTRLESSLTALYGQALPDDLHARVRACAAEWPLARLRVLAAPGRSDVAAVELDPRPLERPPEAHPVTVAPVLLPGGLGEHKWRDRRLVDELVRRLGATPLFADLGGELLEAGYANLWVVKGNTLTTPALDGRLLGGTVRARVLAAPPAGLEAREAPIPLETLGVADEILLTSSIRGVHPAALPGREARFEVGALVRDSLEHELAAVGAP